jgi:replicative DNA helicase
MSKHSKQAEDYIGAGLAVMPVTFNKGPIVTSVNKVRSQPLTVAEFTELEEGRPIRGGAVRVAGNNVGTEETPIWETRIAGGIAILTGAVSGSLEAIDVDTKYDLTGTLWSDLSKAIQSELPDLWPLLTIVETRSGGRHILYRCETIAGNFEIAKRPKDNGIGSHAVIETRGEGGWLVAAPTEGYKLTQGTYLNIPTITPEKRAVLWAIAAEFDQMPQVEEPTLQKPKQARPDGSPKTPLQDYNERGDVVSLLTARGWRVVMRSGQKTYLLRSGNPTSGVSGNFHEGHRKLYLFSTSTEFEAQKSLSPSDIFIKLECNGNTSEAARKLRAMQYGDPYKPAMNKQTKRAVPQVANVTTPQAPPISLVEVGISVNIINRVTGETTNVPDLTKLAAFRDVAGEVEVTSNGDSSQVLLIAERAKAMRRRIYISQDGQEFALWEFALWAVIERHSGDLGPSEQDALLTDIVQTGLELEPLDRDRYLKAFTLLPEVEAMGVKLETLQTVTEKLQTTIAKERQRETLTVLLREADTLTGQGNSDGAIDKLTEGLNEARAISNEVNLQRLLIPTMESAIKDKLANAPEGIITDYTFWEYDMNKGRYVTPWTLTLPAGALTVVAGASGHGKTSLMMNLALKAVEAGRVAFFNYEESKEAVTIKTLLAYIKEPISGNSRKSALEYFKKGTDGYISDNKRQEFHEKRKEFFSTLVETGRLNIQDVTPTAEELCDAIRYLHKETELGAVFVDYIQLLRLKEVRRGTSRQDELSHICELLKRLAKETGLPIILGAQFNREVNNPTKMHYTKIREAADIEHSASLILGAWDNSKTVKYLFSDTELKAWNQKMTDWRSFHSYKSMFVQVLKNREGRDGLEAMLNYNSNSASVKDGSSQEGGLRDSFNPIADEFKDGDPPLPKRKPTAQRSKKKSGDSEVVNLVRLIPPKRK